MGWDPQVVPDPQDESTFLDSKLRWDEADGPGHAALLDLYRRLIRARRNHPALCDPSFAESVDLLDDGRQRWIVVRRSSGVTVAVNLGDATVAVSAEGTVIVATVVDISLVDGQLVLPARSAAVLIAH